VPHAAFTTATLFVIAVLLSGCATAGAGTEATGTADAPCAPTPLPTEPVPTFEAPRAEPQPTASRQPAPVQTTRPTGSSDTGSRYVETGADPLGQLAVETSPLTAGASPTPVPSAAGAPTGFPPPSVERR
jgi:hypothetical protein